MAIAMGHHNPPLCGQLLRADEVCRVMRSTRCGDSVCTMPMGFLVNQNFSLSYLPSPNQGLMRMPSTLPAKAATSQSQPCRLDEATPLKNAPILHP